MEEIIEQPIKVYIKVNDKNEVVEVGSNIFIEDTTDWIEIDEGFGDKYAHAQSQYFEKPLINDNGMYSFKYINNKITINE